MVFKIMDSWDLDGYYNRGLKGANCIKAVLEKNNLDIDSFDSILDFGCGCGRIIRHWNVLNSPKLCGCDYNKRLVNWCVESIPFAEFKHNQARSRLDYTDGTFDFIYVLSVFTHLKEDLQYFWIDELSRVLAPGGYLYITVYGTTRTGKLTPAQYQQYESEQLVLVYSNLSGTNACNAYHPEEYVRRNLKKELDVVDFVAAGQEDIDQDVFLLRKPAED
jgi:SAM-dependent methyltransferase